MSQYFQLHLALHIAGSVNIESMPCRDCSATLYFLAAVWDAECGGEKKLVECQRALNTESCVCVWLQATGCAQSAMATTLPPGLTASAAAPPGTAPDQFLLGLQLDAIDPA